MLIDLDHSSISMGMEDTELGLDQDGDPTSTWIQLMAPLFRTEDLETLEGQAEVVGDIGPSTS